MHLVHARDGIGCNWEECCNVPHFTEITKFLAHAATAHSYDVNLKLCHLPQASQTNWSDISSSEMSLESESRQRTETPVSSVELEMGNIDPRLLEAHPVLTTEPLPCHSDTESLTHSDGFVVKNSHPGSTEVPIRRSTRSTAKVTDVIPAPELKSEPQHVRLSRRYHHAEEQRHGEQRENKRPDNMKAPKGPPLRRSKRLRTQ